MMPSNPAFTPCSALLARCGKISPLSKPLTERWSNGQTEGQINRLKTLKRGIFGRASIELLRARMPLSLLVDHTD